MKAHGILLAPGDAGEIVHNHIITGFFIALASYISVLLAVSAKGWLRLVYLCSLVLTSYQFFLLIRGVLVVIFTWHYFFYSVYRKYR